MPDLLSVEQLSRRLWRGTWCSPASRCRWQRGRRCAPRPQRYGQDDANEHHRRRYPLFLRQDRARWRRHHAAAPRSARARRRRLGAAGTQYFQIAHRAREPDRGRAPRALDYRRRSTHCSRGSTNGGRISAINSPAESSRCSRSRRALVLNPRVLLLDEPLEGLAPIIVDELLAALRRIIRDEGMSAILVEQNAKKILGVTDHAIIIERGAWCTPPKARRW